MAKCNSSSLPLLSQISQGNGLTYWTMGAPVDETIIINRCKKENTYEVRASEGRLPE